MRALALVLLLALPCRAQSSVEVSKALVYGKDGVVYDVLGGCWLSDERCISTGIELARLRAENAELRKSEVHPALVGGAFVVGLLAGAVTLHVLTRKP